MKSLQEQVSETISELVFQVLAPQLLSYINSTIVTRDGEQLSSQQAFERAIKEDKDLLLLIEKYKPSYLYYINKAKRIRRFIKWDSKRFTILLANYLRENGIYVSRSEERRVGKECRSLCDWSSDVCSSDLLHQQGKEDKEVHKVGQQALHNSSCQLSQRERDLCQRRRYELHISHRRALPAEDLLIEYAPKLALYGNESVILCIAYFILE